LLKGQQKLENLSFMQAKPWLRSTDQKKKDNIKPKMEPDVIRPSIPEETSEFNVKVKDNSPLISPSLSHLTLPISEPEDNICLQQEIPDPPVLEFDVEIRQESLTPPWLHFDGSRSPSMQIHKESMTLLPLFFECLSQKRKASGNLDSDNSEGDITDDNGVEDVQEAESAEAWEEKLDETLMLNAEIQDWAAL
jgi:hypothetical protein